MSHKVTGKYTAPDAGFTDGEHYTVADPSASHPPYREIGFYRAPDGSEVAMDGIRHVLADDGEIFRAVKAAVEEHDQAQNSGGLDGSR